MENLNVEELKGELESHIAALKETQGWIESKNTKSWINIKFVKKTLALITSQEQRIKELTAENEAWQKQLRATEEKSGKAYHDLACEVEDLRAENERLNATFDEALTKVKWLETHTPIAFANEKSKVKADTVRKMEDRLKEHFLKNIPDPLCYSLIFPTIDQVIKEIVGKNENTENPSALQVGKADNDNQ